jgi:hypothetical protein
MLQQGLKCFKEKKKKFKNLVGGSVAFQSPCPHGRAVMHDGSVRGGGIEIYLKFKIKKNL